MADAAADGTDRISGSERIAALDVIRGIAILFILFMNMPAMAGYFHAGDERSLGWSNWDRWAFIFQFSYLDGTQRGLLELLFGAGMMIMARNAMRPDAPIAIADLNYRRNWLLVGFGIVNAGVLMWFGDILIPYGIVAMLVFPFRLLKARNQLIVGMLFLLVASASTVARYETRLDNYRTGTALEAKQAAHHPLTSDEQAKLKAWHEFTEEFKLPSQSPQVRKELAEERATRVAPLPVYAKARWNDWVWFYQWFPLDFIVPEIAGTMILGMALFQLGIIQGRASRRTYLLMLLAGYAVGIGLRSWQLSQYLTWLPFPKSSQMFMQLSRIAVTFGHLGLLNLALRSHFGRLMLGPLAANGRMPLTTYLSASFVTMWILFPSFGLGLWGHFSFAGMLALAAAIIAVQAIAANIWLLYYETGPLEWVWKSLAYQRRMPFRRRGVEPTLPPGLVPAE